MQYMYSVNIQLFRERLSEKVHATILKGIVGGFEFTVLSLIVMFILLYMQ